MATEPTMGPTADRRARGPCPRRRGVSALARGPSKSSSVTPAGMATTRSGGAPAAITIRRISSPLVMTRSASHRYTGLSPRRMGMDTCRVRTTGTPRPAAPPCRRASRRSSCACGRGSTRFARMSRTRARRAARSRAPRIRSATAGTPARARPLEEAAVRAGRRGARASRARRSIPPRRASGSPGRRARARPRCGGPPSRDRLPHRARHRVGADRAHARHARWGTSARKQGAQGAPGASTRAFADRGALSRGSVGPKRVTVAMPRAARQMRDAGIRAHEASQARPGDAAAAPAGRGPRASAAPSRRAGRPPRRWRASPGPPRSTRHQARPAEPVGERGPAAARPSAWRGRRRRRGGARCARPPVAPPAAGEQRVHLRLGARLVGEAQPGLEQRAPASPAPRRAAGTRPPGGGAARASGTRSVSRARARRCRSRRGAARPSGGPRARTRRSWAG